METARLESNKRVFSDQGDESILTSKTRIDGLESGATEFALFLMRLFQEGVVKLSSAPERSVRPSAKELEILTRAYEVHASHIAGDPPEFDADCAFSAARVVQEACWALVDRSEPVESLRPRILTPLAAKKPSQHLSADLTFQYVALRAQTSQSRRARRPVGRAAHRAASRWPLSGAAPSSIDLRLSTSIFMVIMDCACSTPNGWPRPPTMFGRQRPARLRRRLWNGFDRPRGEPRHERSNQG